MNIDAYSTCPCHPDKKIKFCCGKEIASELNQIVTFSSAGQELAALDEIERVIQKQGAKVCLLTLKTRLLISRDQIEDADQANELLLQNSPRNVTGHFHRCLIRLRRDEIAAAVNALQDAIDHNPSDEIPVSLATGFRMVGIGLLREGHLIGGRAHLQFASLLKDHADRELLSMVMQTFHLDNTPLFLQRNFEMPSLSDQQLDQGWAKKYHNAALAVSRGQFRKAYRYLKKIDSDYPDTPTIKRGIAVLSLFLGCEIKEIAAAWKQVANLDGLPVHEAIEAEGLYRLFNEDKMIEEQKFVTFECEIRDFKALVEKCFSENRLVPVPYDDDAMKEIEGDSEPPPRHRFVILDKPAVSAEEINIENTPLICGSLNLFGKQTDREARIVAKTVINDHLPITREFLQDRFGELMLSELNENETGKLSPASPSHFCQWHFPPGISDKKYIEIFTTGIKRFLVDQWCDQPNQLFDGMSPLQAAEKLANQESSSQESEYRLTLEWALAEFENDPALYHDHRREVASAIRKKLNLNQLPKLASQDVDIANLSCVQFSCLDFSTFADQELIKVLQHSTQGQHPVVLREICLELLRRPATEELSHAEIYSLLASTTFLFDEGIEYFAKARAICHEQELPIGCILMDELEFRFQRGRTEKIDELYNTIRLHHLDEPYVRQRLENFVVRLQAFVPKTAQSSAEVSRSIEASAASPASPPASPHPLSRQTAVAPSKATTGKLWLPE